MLRKLQFLTVIVGFAVMQKWIHFKRICNPQILGFHRMKCHWKTLGILLMKWNLWFQMYPHPVVCDVPKTGAFTSGLCV